MGAYGDGGRYIDGRIEKMRVGERGKWWGYHEEREKQGQTDLIKRNSTTPARSDMQEGLNTAEDSEALKYRHCQQSHSELDVVEGIAGRTAYTRTAMKIEAATARPSFGSSVEPVKE